MIKVNLGRKCIQLYSISYYLHSDVYGEERFIYNLDKFKLIDILKEKLKDNILSAESFDYYNNFINQEVDKVNSGMVKVYLFITILLWRVLTEKSQPWGYYKTISNAYLHKYFRYEDISTIVKLLIAAEIIDKPSSYSAGRWSKSYRFHPDLKLMKTIRLDYDTNCLGGDKLSFWAEEGIKSIDADTALFDGYYDNFKKIEITADSIDIVKKGYFKKGHNSKLCTISATETLNSFANRTLKDKDYSSIICRYDIKTGRIFTNLSNYAKDYRYLLRYKKRKLVQVDCSACHPLLLLKHYERAVNHSPEAIAEESKRYHDLFDPRGDFYMKIGTQAGIDRKDNEEDEDYRDRIKKNHFFKFLYDKPRSPDTCPLTKVYKKHYGILLEIINHLKSRRILQEDDPAHRKIVAKPHGQFSFINFRLEGEIMIFGVAKDILNLTEPFWFTTIHDCIICQPKYAQQATQIMAANFKRVLGYRAYFKTT